MNQPDILLTVLFTHFWVFLSVGLAAFILLITGLFFIFKNSSKARSNNREIESLSAIAGEDVLTTQLDLARAFIETDHKQSAKTILKFVLKQGSASQQQEAKRLLKHV